MIFFQLFTTAFMSIFYGVVITAAVMAILYFLLRQFNRGIVESVPFYITGVVLFLLLTIQFSLMMGAIDAKSYVDGIEIYVQQLVEGASGLVTAQESQEILDEITSQNHLIGLFFGTCNFSGNDISQLPAVMAETFRSNLNSYIWHRVGWAFFVIVVAVVIAIYRLPLCGFKHRGDDAWRQDLVCLGKECAVHC